MTTLPPPDEPDIYEALLAALVQASETIRVANAAYAAALPLLRQAMEMLQRQTVLMEQVGELSNRARLASREAESLANQDRPETMRQARTLFEQAAELHGEAAAVARRIYFAMMQASPLMLQGVAATLAASEEHRIGLERASTLLQQARRRQTNGDRPDAQAA